MTIKIIAYKGKGLTSRLIRWYTFGDYSHVEWLVDEYRLVGYGSWERIGGVEYTKESLHKVGTPYTIWDIYCTDEQYTKFKDFMIDQRGKKYDWRGILGFPLRMDIDKKDKWFCSEILTEALRHAGIKFLNWDEVLPSAISPNKFVLSPLLTNPRTGKTKKEK